MEIKALEDLSINENALISFKKMGHNYELCYCEHRNNKIVIQLIDKDNYIYLPNGEVRQCNHIESRADNKLQVSQSLKRLREYINTNVIDTSCCKWITLTYKENMTDTSRLYKDFKRFITRFKRKFGNIEYIVACEPQGRGAWHLHCIFIFDKKCPYIPNNIVASLWGQGFTKTQKLSNNIDNIGAYLTAYLGDMSLEDAKSQKITFNLNDIKEVTEIDNMTLKKPKKFVKGARLTLYPPNFNLYRVSRGIKKPTKELLPYGRAKEKVGSALKPTYVKGLTLLDAKKNFSNKIIYEYYNTHRQ